MNKTLIQKIIYFSIFLFLGIVVAQLWFGIFLRDLGMLFFPTVLWLSIVIGLLFLQLLVQRQISQALGNLNEEELKKQMQNSRFLLLMALFILAVIVVSACVFTFTST